LAAALCPDPLREVTPLLRLLTEFREGTVGLEEGKGVYSGREKGNGRVGGKWAKREKNTGKVERGRRKGKGGRKAENGP